MNGLDYVSALYGVQPAAQEAPMPAPHDARFYRFLAAEEAKVAASAPRKRSKMTSGDRRTIAAAVARGAISADRAVHYAELAIAGEDISGLGLYAGRDGLRPGPAEDEDQLDADAIALYPPEPGKEREWETARVAASRASVQLEEEDFSHLFPPAGPEEADEQQRVMASRPPRREPPADEWEDDAVYAAAFGDATYTAHGRPHVPHSGGRR